MMINTFKFSKGLIISIVYNVIILTFVKCDGSGTEDNNPRVPDYEPGSVNDKNYFEYHFRNTYPGQFKLNPKMYFASKYNCLAMVLPELKYTFNDPRAKIDNFKAYKSQSLMNKKYRKRLNKLKKDYHAIKKKETEIDEAIEKTYNATKEAYFAVDNIKDNKYDMDIELLKSKKDIAIQDYQDNQMSISTQRSSISVIYEEMEIFYEIKNFELYINPTKEMFRLSKVIEEEISALEEAIQLLENESCHTLNYEVYYEVIFLYLFLPKGKHETSIEFEKMKIEFQASFNNSTLAYKRGDFYKNEYPDYKYVTNLIKSKYVVNNENYLSYLIRLKTQGYIGIHHTYHKHLYGVRKENYLPDNLDEPDVKYTIDMDLYEENFERTEIQPIEIY